MKADQQLDPPIEDLPIKDSTVTGKTLATQLIGGGELLAGILQAAQERMTA